ncbi:MAG: VTT domain-containing protein [Nanoarchaeota archaeon]|nr:VTT domain-containing protein [Nanoarchaeota archaeon]
MMPNIFNELALLVSLHPYMISFISGVISEELVVFLAILSGRDLLPFWIVLIFGTLGALFLNSLWFLLGKSRFGKKIDHYFLKKLKKHKSHIQKLYSINRKRNLFYLIGTKFIYGTRNVAAFYYGMKGMGYKKFIVYDSIAMIIWALIMLPAGWLAGNGFNRLLKLTRGVEKFLAVILFSAIVIYIIQHIIRKILVRNKSIPD